MKQTIKQTVFFFFFFLFTLTVFVACKKENKSLTTVEKQLSAREWQITSITRPKISNPAEDSSIAKNCSTDDRLTFGINGNSRSFQFKDNSAKCDTTIFQYDNGAWLLNSSENNLQLNGAIRLQNWKILLLNDSILKVQWLDSISTSNKVLKTITLKNK